MPRAARVPMRRSCSNPREAAARPCPTCVLSDSCPSESAIRHDHEGRPRLLRCIEETPQWPRHRLAPVLRAGIRAFPLTSGSTTRTEGAARRGQVLGLTHSMIDRQARRIARPGVPPAGHRHRAWQPTVAAPRPARAVWRRRAQVPCPWRASIIERISCARSGVGAPSLTRTSRSA